MGEKKKKWERKNKGFLRKWKSKMKGFLKNKKIWNKKQRKEFLGSKKEFLKKVKGS